MTDQQEIYKDFMNYNWDSFAEFQEGLQQILENHLQVLQEQDGTIQSIPALDKQQLINQAKSFFYCSHTGNILNLDDYMAWKAQNGSRYEKSQKISEVDRFIEDPTNESGVKGGSNTRDASDLKDSDVKDDVSDPPYSSNYQELVDLIVSGKPVPGIKEIPDTVLTEQISLSEAKQRVKPWEKST